MRVTKNRQHTSGFTLVEMLVIAPVVILAIGAFLTVTISMTGEVLVSRANNMLLYEIQDTLDRIENDVKLSAGFLGESNIPLTSPQGYDNDTTPFSNVDAVKGSMLILNTVATTTNPLSLTGAPVLLANRPNVCGSRDVGENVPMTMNIVYFIKDSTLWRRTIASENYQTDGCSVPWQQPSCLPGQTGALCKTQDVKLLSNVDVEDFSVQYLSGTSSSQANSIASDATAPLATRMAALESVNAVGISLNISRVVAGREINQTGDIRAIRSDAQASSIRGADISVVPNVPTVVGTVSSVAPTATFEWSPASGATEYTLEYNINGGAWQTGFTNKTIRTFTVQTARHTDFVSARVAAISPAGTSAYGSTSVLMPRWTNLTLQNGWTNYAAPFAPGGFTMTGTGLIVLQGLIMRSGNSTPNEVIAVLPPDYRPAQNYVFQSVGNGINARVDVRTNGEIRIVSANFDVALNGISFNPAGTTFTNITPPFNNGWVTYSDPTLAIPPSYTIDSAGRVELRAMVSSGIVTDGTSLWYMPVGTSPMQYMHVPAQSNTGNGTVGIHNSTDRGVYAKGNGNGWYSIHAIYFPASRVSGSTCTTQWCSLVLQSSWASLGAPYPTPEFTKASDGVVHLKGMIRSGSTAYDAVIAQLPVGYRPSARIIFETQSAVGLGRVDIDANGYVRFAIGSNTWLGLDGIHFVSEQ